VAHSLSVRFVSYDRGVHYGRAICVELSDRYVVVEDAEGECVRMRVCVCAYAMHGSTCKVSVCRCLSCAFLP
jgi:hypothetical protein